MFRLRVGSTGPMYDHSFSCSAAHLITFHPLLWDYCHCIITMGKLNIAHHKSYHPYRRDNIERVRRDEEEARQKEAIEEGRMMLAVRPQYIRSV